MLQFIQEDNSSISESVVASVLKPYFLNFVAYIASDHWCPSKSSSTLLQFVKAMHVGKFIIKPTIFSSYLVS